ncbi:hypothetical protein HK405_005418, partial [Cladochytrium tenue]
MFWAKTSLAMAISIFGLSYYTYKVLDLHQNASPPSSSYVSTPITISNTSGDCDASKTGYSRLQLQEEGKFMFGLSLDWSISTPTTAVATLGFSAAIYNTFMEMDATLSSPYDTNMLNWYGSEVAKVGGILEVSMDPVSNISDIPDSVYIAFATQLKQINSDFGVPVLLRWAHEMNANWVTYGYQPVEYVASFQKLSKYVHEYTNLTALVWGPNVGISYPWTDTNTVSLPTSGTANFKALDTNNDGVINTQDDPYLPYYPGDDYVDWVALSLYYYPLEFDNEALPDGYFYQYLTGKGSIIDNIVSATDLTSSFYATRNFYEVFAVGHNKPFLLPETGAPFIPTVSANAGEVNIKMAWLDQLLGTNATGSFPLFQAAANFEFEKTNGGYLNDWRLLNSSTVLAATKGRIATYSSDLVA